MSATRKPDFFIVGAPKSGTTSLYFYLKSHPQVFLPRRKELYFFCDDFHFTYPILSEEKFLSYYKDVKEQKAIGEASVWNLYSANAAKNIFHFNPDSKIIILLRHPVDMLYALHSNHVFNDNEIIAGFEEALEAEPDRIAGKRISPVIKSPVESLYYTRVAKYAEQVQRYYDAFGKEKVKVVLFDDFVKDTRQEYLDIVSFLNIDDGHIPEFRTFNASKITKSESLKRLTVAAPTWLRAIGKKIFPHQTWRRDRLMQWLWKINTKEEKRKEMDPLLRKKLVDQFRTEIQQLEKVIGRDLSRWL